MALDAKYVAFNAASKALAVALQVLLDGLNAGTQVYFFPMPGGFNGTALSTGDFPSTSGFGAGTTGTYLERIPITIKVNTSTANMRYDIEGMPDLGRLPLFWKVSDASQLLSDA